MKCWFKSLFAVALSLAISTAPAFAVKSLVRVNKLSKTQMKQLAAEGYDIPKFGPNFLEAVLDQKQLKALQAKKLSCTTLVPDLDKYVSNVIAAQKKGAEYFTYKTMTEAMKAYVTKYPNICRMESIGKSYEKRDIWALKISSKPVVDQKKPAVLVMGLHHSREWISVEIPMATIKALLEGYEKDEKLTRLVNEREIWFVPMVNPDGLTYSQTQSKYWRKNRRKNADGSFGVDPNRNYGFQWGDVGASDSPGDDTYHGTGPFSEPETCAIRDLARREHFSADITFHSYSELVLWPWSYTGSEQAPDNALLEKFAKELAAFNKYTPEQSSDLYPSMGDTDDFMYGELKSLSFTFELAKTFIPAPTEIAGICQLNVPAVLHLIDKAGTYGLVTPTGEENIPQVDTTSLISALTDLSPLAARENVMDRLHAVEKELAKRLVAEQKQGRHDIAEKVQGLGNLPAGKCVLELASHLQKFEVLHQKP